MMRRFKNMIMVVIAILIFSGCIGGKDIKIGKLNGVNYSISYDKEDKELYIDYWGGDLSLKEELHILSKKVLDLNETSFVLTGTGVNNLNGFPINTYKELNRYVELHNKNKKFTTNGYNGGIGKTRTIRSNFGDFIIYAMIARDEYKNSFISVWDAQKTFNDTK